MSIPTPADNDGSLLANHNAQDYQMQLMLLEQQQKRVREIEMQNTHEQEEKEPEMMAMRNTYEENEATNKVDREQHYTISEDTIPATGKNKLQAIQNDSWKQNQEPTPSKPPSNNSERPITEDSVKRLPDLPFSQTGYFPGSVNIGSDRLDQLTRLAPRRDATKQPEALLEPHGRNKYNALKPSRTQTETDASNTRFRSTLLDNDSRATILKSIDRNTNLSPNGTLLSSFNHEFSNSNKVNEMTQQIYNLELENNLLRQNLHPSKLKDTETCKLKDTETCNIQVFHCLDLEDSGDIVNEGYESFFVFLSEPDWEIQDDFIGLRGQSRVMNPVQYAKTNTNAAFIVYKSYSATHQEPSVMEAIEKNQPLCKPEPIRQDILILSDDMIEALEALFNQYPTFEKEFSEIRLSRRLYAPYIWWYHFREVNKLNLLTQRHVKLVKTLTDWIDANYGSIHNKIQNSIARGRVTNEALQYLIQPGTVLISKSDASLHAYIADERPIHCVQKGQSTYTSKNERYRSIWQVKTRSIAYDGAFQWCFTVLDISFEAESEYNEVEIADLDFIPLDHADRLVKDRLKLRGETFWKCRNRRLISYSGSLTNRRDAV